MSFPASLGKKRLKMRQKDRQTDYPLGNDSEKEFNLDLYLKIAIVNKPSLFTPTTSEITLNSRFL